MSAERPDPYATLGVERGASDAQIKAAYRQLVRALHPDTHGMPDGARDPDPDRLARVLAAYALLRDPAQRARHDRDAGRAFERDGEPDPAPIPVRVNVRPAPAPVPRPGVAIIVGPVRYHGIWQ